MAAAPKLAKLRPDPNAKGSVIIKAQERAAREEGSAVDLYPAQARR